MESAMNMPEPTLKKEVEFAGESSLADFAPKKYTRREHTVLGLKIFLITGLLFGLLWFLSTVKGQ
jgi:hypothetical protein